MPVFDSIVIGEDWISEHYFTTDSVKESFQGKVIELRKQWDAEAKENRSTFRHDFLSACGELQVLLASLAETPTNAPAAHALTRRALGYGGDLIAFRSQRAGAELEVPYSALPNTTSVVFIQAEPVENIEDLLDTETGRLIEQASEDGKPLPSVSKTVSALFRADEPPAFVVVQAGQWILITEQERWAEGRYLAIDLLVVTERRHDARGGEIDRVAAILGSHALLPDADGNIWWQGVLEDSVKHTVGVSKDLREGIRLSIEIIANEVVRRRKTNGLTLDGIDAQELAKHSLRFLYRILFLLYAEASPEMKVLPTDASEYEQGYGLDRLRELTLAELISHRAKSGTHLYESLATLFRLVDRGHTPPAHDETVDDVAPGLEFNSLRADLFAAEATALIDEVGLGNEATQQVLEHLLLSKESKGRKGSDRGFISYAELGINQLGAVYEGLMSYTGFFAETDLYEVAKNGDPEKGSWVVPVDRADHLAASDFVTELDETTGEDRPIVHHAGTFVFRLAGRERQQSASYYTPEVLTRFVVSQALAELLDQDGERTTPEQILALTICEPALGSGAFAIEAVRQLASEYLKRKQEDLGKLIDADSYAFELQKVKAHIALHQVYGVDLNATAVELAEISLWLDTMVAGLRAPWFGLHLRRGNSLIGARRAVYAPTQLARKAWLSTPPKDIELGTGVGAGIHHFLLPSRGWGAVIDTAEAKRYAPEKRDQLRLWRNGIHSNPSTTIRKRLSALAQRVETLWGFTLRRLTIAESEIRRDIDLWGGVTPSRRAASVTREQIEIVLGDENGAYQRLRRVMDTWCGLWSWPLTSDIDPPNWDAWIGGMEALLGVPPKAGKFEKYGQLNAFADLDWEELNVAEGNDLTFARARSFGAAKDDFPWLSVAERVADAQGFLHWELDFAQIFSRGGFDLQVGNPPWVRPDWDEAGVLAEFDPWWQLVDRPSEAVKLAKREQTLAMPGALVELLAERSRQAGMTENLGSAIDRPVLTGLRTDLYRCFMERTWRLMSEDGVVGLIHPESHFSELRAKGLRRATYPRLRRHWQFRNERRLFTEINNTREYGVHIYRQPRKFSQFIQASMLFHPDTATRSLIHDGSGTEPGVKTSTGEWDTTAHAGRILRVDDEVLASWAALIDEGGTAASEARMLYPINRPSGNVLRKIAMAHRLGDLEFEVTPGWNETTDRQRGFFTSRSEVVDDWKLVIIQGPHFAISNPLYQQPNESMRSNKDHRKINLEGIGGDFVPRTSYQLAKPYPDYIASYPKWKSAPSSTYYRLAWRAMADPAMVRTLNSAILPPGPCHVHAVLSGRVPTAADLAVAAGIWSSLPADFFIKVAGLATINRSVTSRIPHIRGHPLEKHLILRTLRLNCLVRPYSALWEELYSDEWRDDSWVQTVGCDNVSRTALGEIRQNWEWATPLRRGADRRQAQVEIDAIVAIMLGIDADELATIYRTQFPVLRRYESEALYDSNGRQLPATLASAYHKRDSLREADLSVEGVCYNEPFTGVDRERDMKLAHRHFSQLLP